MTTPESRSPASNLADLLEKLDGEAMPAPWKHIIESFRNYIIISEMDQPAEFSHLASAALAVAMRNYLPEIIAALRATSSEMETKELAKAQQVVGAMYVAAGRMGIDPEALKQKAYEVMQEAIDAEVPAESERRSEVKL